MRRVKLTPGPGLRSAVPLPTALGPRSAVAADLGPSPGGTGRWPRDVGGSRRPREAKRFLDLTCGTKWLSVARAPRWLHRFECRSVSGPSLYSANTAKRLPRVATEEVQASLGWGGPEDILIAEPCVQSDGADPKRTNATSHLKSVKPWGPGTSPRGARPGAGTGRPGAPPPGTAPSPDLPPPHSQPWSPMTPRSPFAPPAKPSNSSRAGGGMGGAVIIRALVRRVFLLWRAPPSIAALPTRPPPTTPPPTPVFDRFAAHVAPAAKGRDLGGPPPPRPPPPRPRRRPRRTVGKT